jgi:hypothetical protein
MNWKDYEKEIFEIFQRQYPDAEISYDVKIEGRFSKKKRQIDILIEQYIAGNRIRIAVDAKYFNKKIDVKTVENYISMLSDIEAHKGLLITNVGYSTTAINRAYYDPVDIELDILNFNELKEFQTEINLPFAGNNAVAMFAPFGWIIDSRTNKGVWLASLYQRGAEFDPNMDEWIYVNFWDKITTNHKISDVLDIQKKEFKEGKYDVKISFLKTIKRNDSEVVLRKVKYKKHPIPEFTGFVEFDEFIFYAVMFSPQELSNKNIRKLENILMSIKPMKVKYK